MIYNLVEYLKTELPTLNFIANGFSIDSPKECITLIDTGGTPTHFYVRDDKTVQVLCRAEYTDKAKQNIDTVYQKLFNKFGLTLPAITVNSVVYPEIILWQVSPIQSPGYVGVDDKNLEMFSYNLIITIQ